MAQVESRGRPVTRESEWTTGLVTLIVLLLAAAASFNGYYDKWGFRENPGDERFSVEHMLDNTAARPFVYRQMNGWLTNHIADATPPAFKFAVQQAAVMDGHSLIGPDRIITANPDWFWRYMVLYLLTFAEWLAALAVLLRLCKHFTDSPSALAATTTFALLFPVLLTQGGYYYDFPELLFFAAVTYCAVRGWLLPLAIIAVAGTTNKETMVFFLPTLVPLVASYVGRTRAIVLCVALMVLAIGVYLLIRAPLAANPGGAFELHFFENVFFYLNALNLFGFERTYGLPLFKGYNIVILLLVGLVARAGWREAPEPLRLHLVLAALVNTPLFLALAYQGEMRNLSLLFVGWTVLLAFVFRSWIVQTYVVPEREAQP